MSSMKTKAGRSGSASEFNTPGTKPGNNRAIPYRKGIAEGMAAMSTPRTVKTNQHETETGWSYAPGLSKSAARAHNSKGRSK